MATPCSHGTTKARGCDHARLGSFCKLVPGLDSWATSCGITHQCEVEQIAEALGGPGGVMHDADGSSQDSGIPAAYTFFAQFVDHDITLDTVTKLHGDQLDDKAIDQLPNLRSMSLDLDCVYGAGPEAAPFMYDQTQEGRMLVGNPDNPNDLPRNIDGRAMIGDPRNDENIFVSQLQLMFIKLHNRRLVGRGFEGAQTDCRYHYQWLVLYDFLRRVCDPCVFDFVLGRIKSGKYPLCDISQHCERDDKHKDKSPSHSVQLCMPVEFSVAAYRFGHTMVRSQYPVNRDYPAVDLFDERFGTLGFSHVPPRLNVDWRMLLDVESCQDYAKSKAIDHLLANELIRMPDPIVGRNVPDVDRSLAFRNLLRGYVLGLPSGQTLRDALLVKGYDQAKCKAASLPFDKISGWDCLPASSRKKLEEHTPLFLYILLEGTAAGGRHLGLVGSIILLEVFGAMLLQCHSFLDEPGWRPDPCIWNPEGLPGDPANGNAKVKGFTLADVVRYLGQAG